MSTKIIEFPVTIAANELLTSIGRLHSGTLMIRRKNKWKICYCIVSQGCLYLYDDWLSKIAFQKQSLKDFGTVWKEIEEHDGQMCECFYLAYRDEHPALHFCCDTEESQKEWVEVLGRTICEVKCKFNPSADSGFGSNGTVFALEETRMRTEDKDYKEIYQRRFDAHHGMDEMAVTQMKEQHALGTTDTDDDYEDVNGPLMGNRDAGQTLGKGDVSRSSSFISVRPERNPICSNELVHEIECTRETITFAPKDGGSQVVPGEYGSCKAKGHQEMFGKIQDELKAKLNSENKGLSCGGPKRDTQSK